MSDRLAIDLQGLLGDSKKLRKDKDAEWMESLDWFKGKQTLNRPSWKANTVTNYLFSQVMTMIPKLTSDVPDYDVRPEVEDMRGQADEIGRLLKRILIRNDFDRRQIEFLTFLLIFGISYYKATWNKNLWGGEGDVQITARDPRGIYLEPNKLTLRDANYLFDVSDIDKISLLRMYPSKRALITEIFRKPDSPSSTPNAEAGTRAEIGRHATGPGAPIDPSVEAYIFDKASRREQDKDLVEIVEAWFYDERTIRDVQKELKSNGTDDKALAKMFDKKDPDDSAYPTGRVVTIVGDTTLDDRPNPFPDFPYVDVSNYMIPGEQYGMSELQQVKPLQEQYNIRSNQIFDMLNYNIAPIRLFDGRAGIDVDEITNRPDQWVPCGDVTGILQLQPPPIQSAIFESLFKLQKDIETIMGVREVSQGSVPGDIRSGFAIEQLQEAAEVRLRLKLKIIAGADLDLGKYLTRMIGVFYIAGTHYPDTFDLRGATPDVFTYTLKTGASLPTSKFAQQQFIQWLFGQKIADELYVVENSEIPGKDDLIERQKPVWDARKAAEAGEIAQANAEAQAAQSAPPANPGLSVVGG